MRSNFRSSCCNQNELFLLTHVGPTNSSGRSVATAVLVELGLKALRQPRLLAVGRHIADRARHTGGAAGTGTWTIPRPTRMFFADPAAILALSAFHGVRLFWWLQSGRGQPLAHMRSRLRLPSTPDKPVALDSRRRASGFLAEFFSLFGQTMFKGLSLLEASAWRHGETHTTRPPSRQTRTVPMRFRKIEMVASAAGLPCRGYSSNAGRSGVCSFTDAALVTKALKSPGAMYVGANCH